MNTSNVSSQSGATSPSLSPWMSQHALISFFLLAYIISWLLSIPVILSEWVGSGMPSSCWAFHLEFVIATVVPAILIILLTRGRLGYQPNPRQP